MTRHIVMVLIGFLVLLCSGLLVTAGLESLALASADPTPKNIESTDLFLAHQVRSGESLYRIAETYYGNPDQWETIARANSISSPSQLKAGQVLTIPFPADTAGTTRPNTPTQAHPTPKSQAELTPVIASVPLHSSVVGQPLSATLRARKNSYALTLTTLNGEEETLYHDLFSSDQGSFRYAFAQDRDRDGNEELYTVWYLNQDTYLTRVISFTGTGYAFTEALYNDPFSTTAQNWLASTSNQ